MGTPTNDTWGDISELPEFKASFPQFKVSENNENLRKMCLNLSEDAIDLLSKMVVLEPSKRISAREALNHPYFTNCTEEE